MLDPRKNILISFLCTILFLRVFVYVFGIKTGVLMGIRDMIGNYYPHHIIYGIVILAIVGYISLTETLHNKSRQLLSILFGIGLAFIIDELLVTMYVTGKYSPDFAKMYYTFPTYIPVIIIAIILGLLLIKKST